MRTLRRQKDVLGAAAPIAIATVAVSCDRSRAGSESSPPTAPKPFATPGWFTSAQAPPPLELPGKGRQCLSDTGCTHPPAALPPCPGDVEAQSVDETLASASLLAGQVVTVRGKLSHEWRMMLDYSCSPICCRHEKRTLALLPEHRVGLAALVLNDPARPGVFDCVDDETASCCPVSPVLEQVIAVGRLRQVRPRGDAWMLDDPRLCSLVTRAPPPGLRATAQGCELSGRVFGPDERVAANGVMCGCHGGTLHCKAESPGECFHAGQWHPDGTEFLRPRGSEMYSCQRGHWSRAARIPMADAQVVLRFARGSLELIEPGAAGVDFVMLPVTPELRLDIRAWIDPAEGQRARQLAGERAGRVHEWLLARGFTAQQLTITLHDVPPGAPVNDVGVTVHDAQ